MISNLRRRALTFVAVGLIACVTDSAIAGDQPPPGIAADHQDPAPEDSVREPIQGTWQNIVTPYNCATAAPGPFSFPALASYSGGGTALSVGTSAPPASRTHVLGAWTKSGHRTYAVVGVALLFDQAGIWIGAQRISNTLALDASDDAITGTTLVEIFDTQGNIVPNAGACATLVGRRLK